MISVVIPVHNRLQFTVACLDSLRDQISRDFRTVVVDDGSTDGTAEVLATDYPEVTVLAGDGQLWWTGATNAGVRMALGDADDDDFILTLNNDTVVPPAHLAQLVTAARQEPDALIGSLIVSDIDGGTIVDGGVLVAWFTAKYRTQNEGSDYRSLDPAVPRLLPADVLSGCGTLIPARLFRRVGLYDERRLPHYAADYELSRRAARAGYKLLVCYDAPLLRRAAATGTHALVGTLGLRDFGRTFWSRRSANSLFFRLRYARLACPRAALPTYVACDAARVLYGSVRRRARATGPGA